MSLSTIYGKSGKGAQVLTGKSKSLPADSMRVLAQIDGKSNAGAIMATLEKFSEQELTQILTQLLSGGYIRVIADDSIKDFFSDSGIASTIDVVEISTEEFFKTEASAHALDSDVKIRQQKEAEARAKAHAEEQLKLEAAAEAQKESERKLLEVTDLLANSGDEIDIEKLAEQKAREEAAAKAKAEAEAKAKREAEEKARREAEARAKREAEEKAKREAEERARLAAEQKAREEAAAKAKAEAEAKAKREAEEKARREAEARAKREAEEKAKREAEERARLAAEQKAREEAAAKAKAEAEAKAKREAEEKARREAEARAKREAEEKAKREAEERARLAAEQKAREGAEEAVLRAKAEIQARAEYVAGEKAREETELLAEQEAKEKARVVAEEKEREEAERIARKHAEAEEKAAAKLEARSVAEELAQEEAKEWEEREPIDLNKLLHAVFRIGRKLFISVSVTALVLLFLLQLVNLSMLVSPLVGPIQKLVSENINEPVTINKVYASLWPKPHLVLDGVAIGGLADIKITTVRVLPELSTVFDDVKTLRYIELSGLTVSQDNLHRPLQWVSAATKQGKLKFDQVFLEKTAVSLHSLEVPPFDGDIKLTPAGKFQSATLNTGDKSIVVQIAPKDETYTIDIVADNWQSPIGAPVVFDELHAVGAIDNNQLTFSQIKGRLYGGNLKATMTVDWTNLWTATGTFKLSEVELEEAMPSFTREASLKGPITSTATFALEANELSELLNTPEINADFSIDDGVINGIDFVRALRVNNKSNAINGSTRFNKFSGKLLLKDGRYQYKQLLLKAGKLTASGEADIQANQNISGTIDVSLAMQSRQLQSHLNLSGKLGSPTLR